MTEQAAFVAEWLRAEGLAPARLLGNSFGSQVAASAAARHRDTVARLVLLVPTIAPGIRRRLAEAEIHLASCSLPRRLGPRKR